MLNNRTVQGTSKLGDSVADGSNPVISHVGIKHEADNKPDGLGLIERKYSDLVESAITHQSSGLLCRE